MRGLGARGSCAALLLRAPLAGTELPRSMEAPAASHSWRHFKNQTVQAVILYKVFFLSVLARFTVFLPTAFRGRDMLKICVVHPL